MWVDHSSVLVSRSPTPSLVFSPFVDYWMIFIWRSVGIQERKREEEKKEVRADFCFLFSIFCPSHHLINNFITKDLFVFIIWWPCILHREKVIGNLSFWPCVLVWIPLKFYNPVIIFLCTLFSIGYALICSVVCSLCKGCGMSDVCLFS